MLAIGAIVVGLAVLRPTQAWDSVLFAARALVEIAPWLGVSPVFAAGAQGTGARRPVAPGVPLGPVMAFWIASPLMDPNMFILTTAQLGLGFTLAKTAAAIGMGAGSGFGTMAP